MREERFFYSRFAAKGATSTVHSYYKRMKMRAIMGTVTLLKCLCSNYVIHLPYLCSAIPGENQSLGYGAIIL